MNSLQQMSKKFLDMLYPVPNDCVLCRQNLSDKNLICKKCANQLIKWQMGRASGHKSSFLYAAAPYTGVFRQAVHKLKYNKKTYFAPVLGELMANHLLLKSCRSFHMVVPIPLAPRKETQRGFNQSELLAEAVSKRLGIPLERKLLIKNRETTTQAHLKREQRLTNVKGVFTMTRELELKPSVLLVDDIITTGATVKEAKRVLYQGGAGKVTVLVWAKKA
jgi:competence protein ComFC